MMGMAFEPIRPVPPITRIRMVRPPSLRASRCPRMLPHAVPARLPVASDCDDLVTLAASEESMHDVRVDVAEQRVLERLRLRRQNREPQLLPEMDGALVCAHHEVELHRLIAGPSGLVQAMLAHGAANAVAVR